MNSLIQFTTVFHLFGFQPVWYNDAVTRIAHYSFRFFSVLSVLLCVATAGIWAWSYFASESFCWCQGNEISVSASQGRVEIYWGEPSNDEGSHYQVGFFHYRSRPAEEFYLYDRSGDGKDWSFFDHGGFSLVGGEWNDLRHWALVLPCWFLLIIFASLPTIRRLQKQGASNALLNGQCSRCGYDLRATPDRCPECGTAPLVETTR